jgi:glyoxylase-like metal-dependent hydrolase (beta-lactamase superfamily II)
VNTDWKGARTKDRHRVNAIFSNRTEFPIGTDAEDFLQGLEVVGMKPERLRAILLTHWHNDHSAGAALLQRKFGVRVYYAAGEMACLTRELQQRASVVGSESVSRRRVCLCCYAEYWRKLHPRQ